MSHKPYAAVLSFTALVSSACAPVPPANGDAGMVIENDAAPDASDADADSNVGGGTCGDPYRLDAVMATGPDLTFEGSTSGLTNALHPYGAGDVMDAEEAVFEFRVPDGMSNIRLSTEGSDFDTLLYVREACSQVGGGADLAFGDDTQRAGSDTAETYSTAYLTGLVPGSVLFVIVDGKSGDGASSGHFRLTISPFTPGSSGNPCATNADGMATCLDASERCSTANVCTRVVAIGSACDASGLANTCSADAFCVSDPMPREGDTGSVCATAGTRAGAPCRASGTPCDSPLVCNGATDAPMCVRVAAADEPCDPTGVSIRCGTGLHCRTVAGTSFCETAM